MPEVNLSFAWFELTDKCNLRCLHCYGKFGRGIFPSTDNLSFSQWEQIIADVRKEGVNSISFIGGEPDLYTGATKDENVYGLLDLAKRLDFQSIKLFTNATLLNPLKIQMLKDWHIKVALSLYSINPAVHDGITQKQGSFKKQ